MIQVIHNSLISIRHNTIRSLVSKERKDLAHSKVAARKAVVWLSKLPGVESVWLGGSRSPFTRRDPRRGSDWDFWVVTKVPNLYIPPIMKAVGIHADVLIMPEAPTPNRKYAQLYPDDPHKVLKK